MIKIYATVTMKPDKSVKGITRITSDLRVVPVTHVKKNYHINYLAKVKDPEENAPHDFKTHNGECWVRFLKKNNKHVKFPVLKEGEVAEV